MASKGLGTKDRVIGVVIIGVERVVTAFGGAGIEKADDGLIAGGAKECMPVIEEQGGLRTGDAGDQAAGVGADRRPSFVAEQSQQSQAERLARPLLRRIYLEIGGNREEAVTVGVGDPQGQDGTLLGGADEVLAEEGVDLVQHRAD